jgi:hypothetical protein
VNGSAFTGKTNGGPLLIQMNVFMTDGFSHGSCQTLIDGVWAGSFGALPVSGDPIGKEGAIFLGGGGYRLFAPSRVYPNVPAGSHKFEVQCASDYAGLLVNGSNMTSSISVIELR